MYVQKTLVSENKAKKTYSTKLLAQIELSSPKHQTASTDSLFTFQSKQRKLNA